MFCMLKEKNCILPMFQSTIQFVKKKNILLMNPNGERWHHLAVKRKQLGIISKHLCGFYYLNCFQSFRTKNKLESDKKKYMKINFSVILPWFLKTSKY